jgi:predicted enzyme related to lactoylglutathione lyase
MPPTLANGKICYIEMPALDVNQSANFYSKVFGWNIRTRGDGAKAFDDTTGQVSGSLVLGRKASDSPGLLVYIMVDDAAKTCREVEAHGGTIVQPICDGAREIIARFRDPAGNVLGIYQEPR